MAPSEGLDRDLAHEDATFPSGGRGRVEDSLPAPHLDRAHPIFERGAVDGPCSEGRGHEE